jgi:hypothetical protein
MSKSKENTLTSTTSQQTSENIFHSRLWDDFDSASKRVEDLFIGTYSKEAIEGIKGQRQAATANLKYFLSGLQVSKSLEPDQRSELHCVMNKFIDSAKDVSNRFVKPWEMSDQEKDSNLQQHDSDFSNLTGFVNTLLGGSSRELLSTSARDVMSELREGFFSFSVDYRAALNTTVQSMDSVSDYDGADPHSTRPNVVSSYTLHPNYLSNPLCNWKQFSIGVKGDFSPQEAEETFNGLMKALSPVEPISGRNIYERNNSSDDALRSYSDAKAQLAAPLFKGLLDSSVEPETTAQLLRSALQEYTGDAMATDVPDESLLGAQPEAQ